MECVGAEAEGRVSLSGLQFNSQSRINSNVLQLPHIEKI